MVAPIPSGSRTYNIGADKNLWATYDNGGIIEVTDDELKLTTLPNSNPSVYVSTSAIPYSIEFDATVLSCEMSEGSLVNVDTGNLSNWSSINSNASLSAEEGAAKLAVNPTLVEDEKVQIRYDFGSEGIDLSEKTWLHFRIYANRTGYSFNVGIFDVDGNWKVWSIFFQENVWSDFSIGLNSEGENSDPAPTLSAVRYLFFETWGEASLDPASFWFTGIYISQFDIEPIRIDVWDTPTRQNVTISYTPSGSIELLGVSSSDPLQRVTTYAIGQTYHFKIEASTESPVAITISNSTWKMEFVGNQTFNYYVATSISSKINGITKSPTIAAFDDFSVAFPPHEDLFQPFWSYAANAPSLYPVYSVLLLLILLLFGTEIFSLAKINWGMIKRSVSNILHSRHLPSLTVLTIIVIFVYFALFHVGNHPFDWYAERLSSYIPAKYGLGSIYSMMHISSTAVPWGGQPPHHVGFPYGPLYADYFWLLGLAYLAIDPSHIISTFSFSSWEVIFKITQTIFALLTGFLIYFMLRKHGLKSHIAMLSMLFFVLNPAVLFDVAIWAQTDALFILLLVIAAISLETGHSTLTWIFIGLTLLTKTTSLPVVLFISILALGKFGVKKSLSDICRAIPVSFLVATPLLFAGYSPSIIYSVVFGKLLGADTPWNATVGFAATLDSFNIWPLITYFIGARGDARYTLLMPPATSQVGETLFLVVTMALLAVVITKKCWNQQGKVFPILALIALALPMLQIDKTSRYFLIAFPFLLLSYKAFGSKLYYAIIGILSSATLISMYGLFVIHPIRWPLVISPLNFNPSAHALNSVILYIFTNDVFITLFSLANIFAFLMVMMKTLDLRGVITVFQVRLSQNPTWIRLKFKIKNVLSGHL